MRVPTVPAPIADPDEIVSWLDLVAMRAYARLRRIPPAPIIGWPIGFWLWLWWAILGQKFLSLLLGQPSLVLWGVIGRVSKPQQSFNLGRYLFIQGTRSTPSK